MTFSYLGFSATALRTSIWTAANYVPCAVSSKVTKEMKLVNINEKEWLHRQGYSKKILLTEDDLKSEGNVVQVVRNEAHTEIKPHYHERMIEIYHILQGNAIVFCGDLRTRVYPGDTLLCEPGEVHGVVNDTDEDFVFAVFKINAKDEDMYWVK
jgi:quercetin dioxygenase-like cupin family protein